MTIEKKPRNLEGFLLNRLKDITICTAVLSPVMGAYIGNNIFNYYELGQTLSGVGSLGSMYMVGIPITFACEKFHEFLTKE